jgi:PAS domain-containing protein
MDPTVLVPKDRRSSRRARDASWPHPTPDVPALTAIVETTPSGIVEWMNDAAVRLLGISARACRGRELLFSFASDRHVIADAMNQAVINHQVQGTAIIRPRERRPVPVAFQIALITDHHGKYLQWTLTTRPAVSTGSHLAG